MAFVFIAVGGSGLIVTTVKRIIARGRPRYFEEFGSLHFQFPTWQASYASFPSGHSQTAFAIALSFAALFPRWRTPLIAAAVVVASSRVAVDAHYFTDIVAGSLWGAWFTIMTREWFARRGLSLPRAGAAPVPDAMAAGEAGARPGRAPPAALISRPPSSGRSRPRDLLQVGDVLESDLEAQSRTARAPRRHAAVGRAVERHDEAFVAAPGIAHPKSWRPSRKAARAFSDTG